MEEEKNGLGLEEIGAEEGGGGEGSIWKIIVAKGATIFICSILGGSKVLIHHTFLKTLTQHPLPPPHLGT